MKILLIEDNPGDARLVQELLKEVRGNFTISVAEKLEPGLKLLLSQDVDAVLLDLNLPDSRGLVTLTELQARFSHVPFVIMTSIDDEELAHQAVRLGAQDYLVKGSVTGELLRRTLLYAVERKQAEEMLRESQKQNAFLAGLIHSSSQPLGVGYPDGRLGLVNRAFEELTGYTSDELLSIDWAAALTPSEWREIERAKLAELNRTGRPIRYEKEYIKKDGTRVPIELFVHLVTDPEGKPQYYYAFVTDITERKRAEEALRHAHAELELRVQDRTKELKELNETLEQRVAERTAELTSANEMLRNSRLASLNLVEDAVAARHDAERANVDLRREVTERKRAEEAVRTAHTELERRAYELAAVNRELEAFSYTVSHDLKAPLRSIEGFTKAVLEDYSEKLDNTGKDYLMRVHSAGQRMTQLINAMLDMARLTRGQLQEKTVDLSSLAQVIAHEIRKNAPQRLVEFIIAKKIKVKGDQEMLQVMLENLFHNAWKFTSKHPTAKIEFGTTNMDGKTVYFVRDDGAGFDMEFSDKLFKPFKRLHAESEFPGIGIGLAIAHRIVMRHNGRIWAKSAPEKGTTFYFTL